MPLSSLLSADGCTVCSGVLHDTWLGGALTAAGVLYLCAAIIAALFEAEAISLDGAPLRGAVWRVLRRPFVVLWRVSGTVGYVLVEGVKPGPRRPRQSRHALERRIADLEAELDIR